MRIFILKYKHIAYICLVINTKVRQLKILEMRKTIIAEKNPKIDFVPSTPEEKKHLQEMRELLAVKRRGDWDLVAEIVGIPRHSVEKAFVRVYSKNHFETVAALDKVIENRRKLLKQ